MSPTIRKRPRRTPQHRVDVPRLTVEAFLAGAPLCADCNADTPMTTSPIVKAGRRRRIKHTLCIDCKETRDVRGDE